MKLNQGNLESVKFLLEAKADTSIPEKDGYTPMHGAGFQGRAEIAKLLIAHGLNPSDRHKAPQRDIGARDEWRKELQNILKSWGSFLFRMTELDPAHLLNLLLSPIWSQVFGLPQYYFRDMLACFDLSLFPTSGRFHANPPSMLGQRAAACWHSQGFLESWSAIRWTFGQRASRHDGNRFLTWHQT